jgi:hypothetical protein
MPISAPSRTFVERAIQQSDGPAEEPEWRSGRAKKSQMKTMVSEIEIEMITGEILELASEDPLRCGSADFWGRRTKQATPSRRSVFH